MRIPIFGRDFTCNTAIFSTWFVTLQWQGIMQCLWCFYFLLGLGITKTCLYNVDPLKPHFYIVKVGFTGVYIIFLISAQNIDCGYSLEPTRRGSSNEYLQSMFLSRNKKNIRIFIWKFSIFKFSVYLNRLVFIMVICMCPIVIILSIHLQFFLKTISPVQYNIGWSDLMCWYISHTSCHYILSFDLHCRKNFSSANFCTFWCI